MLAAEESIDRNGKLHIPVGLATNKESLVPRGLEFGWVIVPVWMLSRREVLCPYYESNPGFQVSSN